MATLNYRTRYSDQLRAGQLVAQWNTSGSRILRYYVDFSHKGLDLHKQLSAPDIAILQNKVDVLVEAWEKKWESALGKQSETEGKDLASKLTVDAEAKRIELRSLLKATLKVDDTVNWNSLKSKAVYAQRPFEDPRPLPPAPTRPIALPQEPEITFFDKLLGRKSKKLSAHQDAVNAVLTRRKAASDSYDSSYAEYKSRLETWEEAAVSWEAKERHKEAAFNSEKAKANERIDALRDRWSAADPDAVIEHATLVLEKSSLPDIFSKNFDLAYNSNTKTLVLEYELPNPDSLPLAKTIRFVAATGELQETQITDKEARELFDTVCYQIALRTIHELLEADTPEHLQSIVFNGFTDSVDRTTGKNVSAVIMSLKVLRNDFLALDLARVEPKACFKALKGVAAASLSGLAAVAPILVIDRSDRRFIDAKSVSLDDTGSTNLAAMHWEDFEHLVRELFEKEFSSRGGEVNVTQASSDGGVDAIAFDPDPITGGKIVIQAKRYTKTVGVSAVRDLYGTVLSEGAIKGILITTADYGPDAHKFALGKPITLLSGSNMLHLLEKHGTKAVIDLKAARNELGLS